MMRKLALSIALLVGMAGAAFAQSNCPYIAQGAVLTPAQWNQCFAAKQNTIPYVPVNKAGDTMLGRLTMTPSTTLAAGFNLSPGVAPTSPNNGDMWMTTAAVFARINGATVSFTVSGSSSFAATLPLTVSFPAGVVTYAFNLANPNTWTGVQTFNSGRLALAGSSSGSTLLNASATASGTMTVPSATDTLMGKATTDTMLNKTFDTAGTGNSLQVAGIAITGNNGTGASIARDTDPVFNNSSAVLSATAGAAAGPQFSLLRGNSIGAANDLIGMFRIFGKDSGGTFVEYVRYSTKIILPTVGATNAEFAVQTVVSGALADRLLVRAGGYMGAVSGGDKGVNTFNATLYHNGTILATVATSGSAADLSTGTLPAGRLPAFTGDVTTSAGSAATTLAAGNAGNLNSGTLLAARMPAFTGDITTSAGAVATTLATNIVSYAKFQQVAAVSIVGNPTGSLANAQGITLNATLGFSGTTLTCTTATSSQIGCLRPDNTTITVSGGVITAIGAAATSIAVGTTTITGGTSTRLLSNTANVLAERIAPTGAILGDTDTQTLTNKTIASASNTLTIGGKYSSFAAHKNGTNQTVTAGSDQDISFGTAFFNVGSNFNTGTGVWTPPAGKVIISWSISFSGLQALSVTQSALSKNGAKYKLANRNDNTGAQSFSLGGTIVEDANGTDTYKIQTFGQAATTYTVDGNSSQSWFSGSMLQ